MRSVRVALALGLAGLAAVVGFALSRPPLSVAGSNGVPAATFYTTLPDVKIPCWDGETLPRGTDALRLSLSANNGPEIDVRVLAGTRLVTEGSHEAGWGVDETVTIPVHSVPHTIDHASICTTIGPGRGPLQFKGTRTKVGGVTRFRIEYLRPAQRSWLSLAALVASRMGIAHAPSGTWVAYLLIAVMLAVSVLASRLLLRELR